MVRVRYVEKKEGSFPTTSDDAFTIQRLLGFVICIEAGVYTKEVYGIVQVVHLTLRIRSKLTMAVLSVFLDTVLPPGSEMYYLLSSYLPMPKEDEDEDEDDMDVDTATSAAQGSTSYYLPEVEIYCYLLLLLFFIDQQLYDEAKECSIDGIARIQTLNRTVDVLAARLYFYYSLGHELTNSLSEIRSNLLALYRVATLSHDELGQETLLNLLLRNYLHYNLYDQAEKLSSKAPRLEAHSNQQFCCYLFYLGKIKTIQLEYTDAKESLLQASRKAPAAARGFLVTCNKWIIIVRLLLGEIPEKAIFTQKGMKNTLVPYFDLAKAVRIGDFKLLQTVTEKYCGVFRRDRTHNLIVRVRQNVIRTGLRNISICYSRISLADVARKLRLNSDNPVVDAESIVSKAILDGVIDAKIDLVNCWMLSKEIGDGYSTKEPQLAFNSRIDFCLNVHNEAVRALRFPPNCKKETKSAKRQQQGEELSMHIEEYDDEYYF